MITRSQTQMKILLGQRRFWLDEIPTDVREIIAKQVSKGGQCTEEALNLSRSSYLQRSAVLECFSRDQRFVVDTLDKLRRPNISFEWAELLAGRIRSVCIIMLGEVGKSASLPGVAFANSPMSQLLRAPQLEKAIIPGAISFLVAIRCSTALRELTITMHSFSYHSVVITLKRVGLTLSKLHITCTYPVEENSGHSFAFGCPMILCSATAPRALKSLCPNLRHLGLDCGHIPPTTMALLGRSFPMLESMNACSCPHALINLAEEDIIALRGVNDVILENVRGGLETIARIGNAITGVVSTGDDSSNGALKLLNCPRLQTVDIQISTAHLKKFCSEVVPTLTELKDMRLFIDVQPFALVKEVAREAVSCIRIYDHSDARLTVHGISIPLFWNSRQADMRIIRNVIRSERGRCRFKRTAGTSIRWKLMLGRAVLGKLSREVEL